MSDFPENKINENEVTVGNGNTASDETEETSTVFADPTIHNKSAENTKKKKKLPIIIASVLIPLILLGGIFAVIKFIPKLEEEEDDTKKVESIKVLDIDADKLKSVTITNSNGDFKFIAEHVYNTSADSSDTSTDSSSSEATVTTTWYQEGVDRDLVSSDVIGSTVNTLAQISASREITQKTAADCGLESPVGKVVYESEDGTVNSYIVGAQSPDQSGYYIQIVETGKIYVVNDTFKTLIEFKQLDVASIATMPSISTDKIDKSYLDDNGSLSKFDKLTVSGKNFPDTLVFVPNSDDTTATYSPYKLKLPYERPAEKIDGIMAMFKTGVSPDAAYSMDVSAASLKAVGLDSPDFVVTMEVGGEKLTYKFKIQDDTSAAVICDNWKLIQRVPINMVEFIKYKPSDFYSSWIALNSIDNVSNLTIKTLDGDYSFDIEKIGDDNSDEKYSIKYKGEKIDTSKFQDFYQLCVGLTAADYVVDNKCDEIVYSFVYTFKSDIGGKNVIDFAKDGASRYQFITDGVPMGRINSSAMSKVINGLKKLVG